MDARELNREPFKNQCSGPRCTRRVHAKGLCKPHHAQMLKGRDLKPLHRRTQRTLLERLFEKVEPAEDGCWVWRGATTLKGTRGHINIDGRREYAYRAMFEVLVGPIPKDLTLDHLCCNTLCVNPWHLEPVTRGENTRRALGVAS